MTLNTSVVVTDKPKYQNQHGSCECGETWVDRRISWLEQIIKIH
jgi:hypothetical protein